MAIMNELPPDIDPTKTPMGVNPDGSPPNFDNPPTLIALVNGVSIPLMILTFVAVVARLISKVKKQGSNLSLDDLFCSVGWILTTACVCLNLSQNEAKRHTWDIPMSMIDGPFLKKANSLFIIVGPANFFTKLAIFTLYLKVFKAMKWMRVACWSGIAVCAGITICSLVVYLYYLLPHGSEKWDLSLLAKGDAPIIFTVAAGAFNVALDIYLLVLPLLVISKLKLSTKRRIGLYAVFMTGLLGIAGSVLCLYFRAMMYATKDADGFWNAQKAWVGIVVELYVAVLVSCAPGCVSYWNVVLRDSALVSSLRSLISSGTAAGSMGSSSSSSRQRKMSRSPGSSLENGLNNPELKLYPRVNAAETTVYSSGDAFSGRNGQIHKSVELEQSKH